MLDSMWAFDLLKSEYLYLILAKNDNNCCVNLTNSFRYTREWNRFKDELDIIKFICKEFWSAIFGKQADTLRTNHQGIYVLIDNQFRFVLKTSESQEYTPLIPKVSDALYHPSLV